MAVNQSENFIISGPFMDEKTTAVYLVIRDVQTKITPAICGLGFVTNLLSLLVFLQPSLKGLSCSVYLAAKAVIDFLFLLTVFIIWLTRVDINAFHYTGICQIIVFVSYLTAFISIWLAVVLTVENLLCVTKPWYVQRSCNAYSAVIITFVIVLLGVMLYHFSLWNNGVRLTQKQESSGNSSEQLLKNVYNSTGKETRYGATHDQTRQYNFQQLELIVNDTSQSNNIENRSMQNVHACMPLEEFNHLVIAMTYVDSLITLFIPLLILVINNAVIILFAVRATRHHFRLRDRKDHYQLPETHVSNQRHTSTALKKQASRFLFAVSMTTMLFHLPSHVVRLKSILFGYTAVDIVLQRICETLYYTHYAIGFFVYIFFGKNFRKVFLRIIAR